MTKVVLAGVLVVLMELTCPALAQVRSERPPLAHVDESLIGLPIISSDGVKLGIVVEVGEDDGEEIAIGAIDQPLGIGSVTVAIPADMFTIAGDSIELVITAAQLRANLNKPARK